MLTSGADYYSNKIILLQLHFYSSLYSETIAQRCADYLINNVVIRLNMGTMYFSKFLLLFIFLLFFHCMFKYNSINNTSILSQITLKFTMKTNKSKQSTKSKNHKSNNRLLQHIIKFSETE